MTQIGSDELEKESLPAPTPANAPGSAGAPTDRDLQRSALRDLVLLSTESAAMESEIERRLQAALEEGKKDLQKMLWQVEDRYKALLTTIQQRYSERVARIDQQFQQEQAKLKEMDSHARQEIEQDHEQVERDVKQKFDQASWLAESVLEATQNGIREDAKKFKEAQDDRLHGLNELENRALALVKQYRFELPAGGEEIDESLMVAGDPDASFAASRETAQRHLSHFGRLLSARISAGWVPYVLFVLLCIAAAVFAQSRSGALPRTFGEISTLTPQWRDIGYFAGGTAVGLIIFGILLRLLAKRQMRKVFIPLRASLNSARKSAGNQEAAHQQREEQRFQEAMDSRTQEVQGARARFAPVLSRAQKQRDLATATAQADSHRRLALLESQRDGMRKEVEEWHNKAQHDARHRYENELKHVHERHAQHEVSSRKAYQDARVALERRLNEGLTQIQAPIKSRHGANGDVSMAWDDERWKSWTPPERFAAAVRVGELLVDLKKIADGVPSDGRRQLVLPAAFSMPAALAFPRQASLLIQSDRALRDEAIKTVQMVMTRLLTSLPAGRVRFTILDPVGLGQNFAGFMHLADHDDALVGGRIWTESEHIEQRLEDLTEHMETVIQKYLRNEYETIDDYNAQAGELAEPYRFLVIADFPVGFGGDAFRRLSSIVSSGARCGVYTLILRDTRQALPAGTLLDDLEAHSVNLVQEGDHFIWKDEVFGQFPLRLDRPPSEEFLTQILDVVGRYAKEAKRVEVPFDSIAPDAGQFWSGNSSEELRVPVGRLGATRLQMMKLGRGVAQHVLIAGKTGSGKSTLLHALVTNLAMWYSPDEVEFYLVDFKKGVEFKTYATHALPHARAIAVESDREFGLSVLQRLDAELGRRGDLFRKAGVQDVAAYRGQTGAKMPRTLLIIDEFQEFFSEDDKLAQEAGLLLDRLVRQGRAFGIHVILGSQTIGGTSGLARSTIGQMAVRVALQTSEADSQLILGDNNSAARLLSRPGEAIYNDQGGLVEANSPFQVAWLPDEHREQYLEKVRQQAEARKIVAPEAIVFEGNAPSDIRRNPRLAAALDHPGTAPRATGPLAWLGEPVAIKEPTAISFRRQSGANLLLVGQQEEQSLAMLGAAMVGLAAQHGSDAAVFYVFDGTPADSPLAGIFPRIAATLPQRTKLIEWRATAEAINELAEEVSRRQAADQQGLPSLYVIIYALQRYRILRKQEEEFSFSSSSEEKAPQTGKQFGDILREGPSAGVHVLAWCDTPIAVDRTLDRNTMREFDNRVLFQMSAADSSNLIDSPAANKLGFFRALAFSEEQGVMEKFRPYALPDQAWLERVKTALSVISK